MVENSLVIRAILSIYNFIWSIYEHSMVRRVIDKLFMFLSEVFRYSILYPLLTLKRIEEKEHPFFMKKISALYKWLIDTLNSVYKRSKENSYLVARVDKSNIGNWIGNSLVIKLIKYILKGVSIEGLMICAFGFFVPFVGKQLSLVMAFGLFCLFIMSSAIKGNNQFTVTKTTVLALFYFLMLSINSILSINPGGSMRDLAIHTGGLLMMFMIINSPLRKKDYQLIFDGLIGAGALVSIYAIYQYIVGVPMGSGWVDTSQNIGLTVRVFGTFENPNIFAEYLILMLPLAAARGLQNLSEHKWLRGFFYVVPGGLMLAALLMTASRAGWLGFALAVVVFTLLVNMKFIIPMILGGIGAIPLLPESILNRISTIGSLSDSSNLYRYNLWKSSFEIINDFFVTGIGTGYLAFRAITPYYMKNMAPYHAHNTYIQTLVEFGLIGLILFLTWCFMVFKDGMDTAQTSKTFVVRLYAAALTAGFCGILLHGFAEHILYYSKIMLLFWVIVGLIIKANQLEAIE